jgi:hypothetical protein
MCVPELLANQAPHAARLARNDNMGAPPGADLPGVPGVRPAALPWVRGSLG